MMSPCFGSRGARYPEPARLRRARWNFVAVIVLAGTFVMVLGSKVVVSTPSAGAATPPTAQVYQVPSSIADNCSTDVTSQLQTWLDSLPNGQIAAEDGTAVTPTPIVVQFAHDGCYLVNGSLYFLGWQNVTFDGNGAELKQTNIYPVNDEWGQTAPYQLPLYCGNSALFGSEHQQPTYSDGSAIMWYVDGGCNLSWHGFNMQGSLNTGTDSSGSPEQDSLMQVEGVQGVSITNNTLDGAWGDFITLFGIPEVSNVLGQDIQAFPDTSVTIANNSMASSGRQGITPIYVQNVLIQDNTIGAVNLTVFDLEADVTGGCTCDVDINDNTITDTNYAWLLSAETGTTVNNFAFTNNTTDGSFKIEMGASYSNPDQPTTANWTFANNTAVEGWGYPFAAFEISSSGVSNVLIEGNTTPVDSAVGNGPQPFVSIVGTTFGSTNFVANNTLTGQPLSWGQQILAGSDDGTFGPGTECGNSVNGSVVDGTCGPITPPTLPTPPAQVPDYPTTVVALPTSGAVLNGSQYLDGVPSDDLGISSVQFEITGGSLNDDVVATGAPTLYGYIAQWNSSAVPDGTYNLQAVGCNVAGNCSASPGISIKVDNDPPTTSVLVPSNGASVAGSQVVVDASATDPGGFVMSKVEFELTGGSLNHSVIATGTPTLYGYLVEWNSTAVSDGTYTLQSVAYDPAGLVGISSGIIVTVSN
jgi:Big-like domain-containing protein